ncbi:MAG: ABC transporter permease [Lachnospiraceae bacterium]|jgi:simple sugar transport system permease protein|nr:ABC transporter permease [Lachnospiraceae bacterium]CCZ28942.1 branched-chain amino acid ABC transporter permease protein [Firmicutes bacterium CAG:194]HCI19015.1 ABC transporter permease [Lachnospiraceae bacterium]HCX42596.1 ABC transporter permease [Lachnospiraceae bacterium]
MTKKIDPFQRMLLIIIVVYSVFVTIKNPGFFQIQTVFDIIKTSSTTMIVAMGLLVVMISGGIDVSFMAIALFGSYTSLYIMIQTGINNLAFAFAVSMAIGVVLGLVNAVLISWLKLPPFIITLGTQNLFHGIMTTFISDKSFGSGVLPECLHKFGQGTLFKVATANGSTGLTVSLIPVLIAGLATYFILRKTMIGRGIVAIGNDEESARRAGFNPFKIRLFVYAYSGALAGMMGIVYAAQVNALYPNKMVGDELMVVAAVVIGGTKITGGQGKIFGAVLGVLITYLLNSTLIMIGLSSSWNNLFVGAILVIAVAITSYQERVKNRKHLIFTE